tara:strand:- start:782 stop:1315 length:534 start_codon:yes stop_codon:yes gene_type:complete
MAEITFDVGELVWRLGVPHMSLDSVPESSVARRCPPNSAVIQRYVGKRHDKKGFHTDSKPTRPGKIVEQLEDTPVISVSLGATQLFWVQQILDSRPGHKKRGVPTVAHVLRNGGAWFWDPRDDHAWEHGVWFPHQSEGFEAETDVRFVVVFRWVRGTREHGPDGRNKSGEEYVEVQL